VSETATVVFVVDDDVSVRRALERLLRSAGHEVESFAGAQEYLAREPFAGTGCLLLDLAMPKMNGLELQSLLSANETSVPVIFLTGHGDIPASVQAMKSGALDFLTKPVDESALLAAVDVALQRQREILAMHHTAAELQHRFESLSARERQVMQLVVSGLLNKQIAAQLGISEKTVKVHRGRVMEKTRSRSLAGLVRL